MSTVVFKGFRAKIVLSGSPTAVSGGIGGEVGRAQSVTVDITNNVDTAFEIGRKNPAAIIEGAREITGTLERFWVDMALASVFLPRSDQAVLPTFSIQMDVNKDDFSNPGRLVIGGAIAEGGGFEVTVDGITADNLDFRAANYSWVGKETVTGPV